MNRVLALALAIVLLAACAAPKVSSINSGVEGLVTIGPTCPVMRLDQPCPDRPYAATLTVLDKTGKRVAQIKADENGIYRLELSPGDYNMHPESPNVLPHAQEQSFTVIAGQFTKLDILYDSGIR
jgi:hypothetical protein